MPRFVVLEHDHPDAVVAQAYLPERLLGRRYYEPTERGREREIADRLRDWRAQRPPAAKTRPR